MERKQISLEIMKKHPVGICESRCDEKAPSSHARQKEGRSSKEGRRADALAPGAEERRDKLRKAAVRSKYPLNRRCLNGETRLKELQSSMRESIAHGGEPPELKHLSRARKRKKHRFSE